MENKERVLALAKLVRKWCLVSTTEAGSGHPTSCLSAADFTTVLFEEFLAYDLKNPHSLNNDRLIFSKGHAAPLLYTLYALSGAFNPEELKTLRKFGSKLEGHPTPEFEHFNVATGSLGQGLSTGCGMALLGKKEKRLFKTYVVLGDGELAEGSIWEAANFASFYKLNNLIAIADINGFGQSQQTMFGHNGEEYKNRFSSFGWDSIMIDGHDMLEICDAFKKALSNRSQKPFVIIANTKKGKGVSFLEDKDGWHGKPLKKEDLEKALSELGNVDDTLRFQLRIPKAVEVSNVSNVSNVPERFISFKINDEIATREVYGSVLAQLAETNPDIYALDGDVKNSTYAMDFAKIHNERYVECFIAEQNMVGVGVGLSKLGKIPFVSTFAAFLTRAFDQIRMARLSNAQMVFVGSHAGVSIGEDGASQMGLEDFALFGSILDSVILHPSDAVSTSKLLALLPRQQGISYLRTIRGKTPVIYTKEEIFAIGGLKVLRQSNKDILTIVGVGVTVFEALNAYNILKEKGIYARVIDCYSLKPIDKKTLTQCIKETKKNIVITVEDHFLHGGLGDFISSALSQSGTYVEKMAITQVPHSGTKEELFTYESIDAKSIVRKVESLLQK